MVLLGSLLVLVLFLWNFVVFSNFHHFLSLFSIQLFRTISEMLCFLFVCFFWWHIDTFTLLLTGFYQGWKIISRHEQVSAVWAVLLFFDKIGFLPWESLWFPRVFAGRWCHRERVCVCVCACASVRVRVCVGEHPKCLKQCFPQWSHLKMSLKFNWNFPFTVCLNAHRFWHKKAHWRITQLVGKIHHETLRKLKLWNSAYSVSKPLLLLG